MYNSTVNKKTKRIVESLFSVDFFFFLNSVKSVSGVNIIEFMDKMQYSSDEISVDSDHRDDGSKALKYLPNWPSVNIEFQDLMYTVPDISGK